jgi:hypothetical protein
MSNLNTSILHTNAFVSTFQSHVFLTVPILKPNGLVQISFEEAIPRVGPVLKTPPLTVPREVSKQHQDDVSCYSAVLLNIIQQIPPRQALLDIGCSYFVIKDAYRRTLSLLRT